MREIQITATKLGHRLFRNNCGYAETKTGQWIKYGIANPGGADLIGWTRIGLFLAIEVKTKNGRLTPEQENFINSVNLFGGIAFVARSVEDVIKHLK